MTEAIITVTTHFNDAQRAAPQGRRTHGGPRRAAHVNEPTVAALAFGLDKKQHGTGLVFGLGGGTVDVGDGVLDLRSMAGDSRLCGDGFDRRLVGHPADKFQQENGIQLAQAPARAAVAEAAEKTKTELNSVTQTPARRRAQARQGRHLRRSRSGSRSWPCRHWSCSTWEVRCPAGLVPPPSRSCAAVEETIAGRG
ncbi:MULTISPECIES: Hsp70 family protein [unclassified Streptomyces]|uniref:Hsp70 family protein n=1 Tax=unclassified Streptomyces TaxID=2593676 RepID=UPI00365B1656